MEKLPLKMIGNSNYAPTIIYPAKYRSLSSADVLALMLGLLALFYMEIVGQLYISEILLVLVTPILWLRRGQALLRNSDVRKILALGWIWFISQVVTDVIRQTPILDLARGWAGIIFLLINFCGLYLLLGNDIRRIKIFAFGFAISGLISPLIQPSSYYLAEPWKFGFGEPISLLIFLFIVMVSKGHIFRIRKWVWLIIAIGALSFYLNARSLGGIVILSGVILWLRTSPLTWRFLAQIRLQNIFLGGLLIGLIGLGLLQGYAYAASEGMLGQKVKEKFQFQDNGSVWGLILGGRFEILGSSQAILDSPIIGHGSWAKGAKYRLFMYQLRGLGFNIEQGRLDYYVNSSDLIPAHSHLTQAWVWSGVLGAVFWFWILIFMGKAVLKENKFPGELYPLVIYFGIATIWDILFSPLGSFMRILWALRFIVFLSTQRKG